MLPLEITVAHLLPRCKALSRRKKIHGWSFANAFHAARDEKYKRITLGVFVLSILNVYTCFWSRYTPFTIQ